MRCRWVPAFSAWSMALDGVSWSAPVDREDQLASGHLLSLYASSGAPTGWRRTTPWQSADSWTSGRMKGTVSVPSSPSSSPKGWTRSAPSTSHQQSQARSRSISAMQITATARVARQIFTGPPSGGLFQSGLVGQSHRVSKLVIWRQHEKTRRFLGRRGIATRDRVRELAMLTDAGFEFRPVL